MKWLRSNIRIGSKLALFALAIQFVLSFGHFHGSALASADAGQPGLHAAAHLAASPVAIRLKTPDHEPAGQPADDCAICAVAALANTMVVATPPYLLAPEVAAFRYLTVDTAFTELNAARVAFQPRAPPIA
jgi:hypothetical protein